MKKVLMLASGFKYGPRDSFNLGDVAQQTQGVETLKSCLPGWGIKAVANSIHEVGLVPDAVPFKDIICYLAAPEYGGSLKRRGVGFVRSMLFLWNAWRRKRGLRSRFLGSKGRKALGQLADSDLLFASGAGNLHDGYMGGVGFFWCLMFIAASMLDIPVVMVGQQVGPLKGFFASRLVAFALRRASFVGVRDPLSYETAKQLGVLEKNLHLTGDDGWHLSSTAEAEDKAKEVLAEHGISGKFISVQFRLDGNNPWEKEIAKLRLRLEELADNYGLPIVFIPFFSAAIFDDKDACRELAKEITATTALIDPGPDAALAKALLGHSALAVGVANHFCVFAASMGVPTIGLHATPYMAHKLQGLQRHCDHVVSLAATSLSDPKSLVCAAETLLQLARVVPGKHLDRRPPDYLDWVQLVKV